MRNDTRPLFTGYLDQQAALNGVDPAVVHNEKQFTVTPAVQQVLIDKQQEASGFLGLINVQLVPEQSGEKLGLGIGSTLASRTNTDANDRATQDPTTLDNDTYMCRQTDSDTHLKYSKLDAWRKFKDFQQRIRNQVVAQQARDRIIIGFNGTSAASQTNRVNNPMLQDVNIGWLEKLRLNKPTHVFAAGAKEANKIIIEAGGAGDYANLDALVYDACHSFLPEWVRASTDLRCIVGDGLLHEKYFPMVDQEEKPTERLALEVLMSKKELGGRAAARVPYMRPNSILITPFDNMSIYEQEDTRRRTIVDNAKRSRVETYESVNEDYVFEDYEWALLIENIQIGAS